MNISPISFRAGFAPVTGATNTQPQATVGKHKYSPAKEGIAKGLLWFSGGYLLQAGMGKLLPAWKTKPTVNFITSAIVGAYLGYQAYSASNKANKA